MRILFLQKRILFPNNTGGKIRTLNVVRHLAKWHDVTYLCNVQASDEQHLDAMCELGVRLELIPWKETPRGSLKFFFELAQNTLSPYPYNVSKDYDKSLRQRAIELLEEEPYDLVICDFVQMARNAIGLDAPAKVLFQHNVEAQIFERHSKTDSGWLRRRYMALQWRKMQRFEGYAGRQFDTVVAVSHGDREIYERDYGWDNVEVIDTAVNLDYFSPSTDAEQPDRVLFLGSMDWLPNQDGVDHFVSTTWPLIRSARPGAVFQIVGRNPSEAIRQLARTEGVEVLGTVPDVRPFLAEAAVVVVPLRIGGGTRLKIFEAMAMEKAVVSTELGAEGLPVESDNHLILADEPAQFADAVVDLLADSERRSQLASNARRLVVENFSAETVARQFESICNDTISRKRNVT